MKGRWSHAAPVQPKIQALHHAISYSISNIWLLVKFNFPMNLHVHRLVDQLVGWLVGREITLLCPYWSTTILRINHIVAVHYQRDRNIKLKYCNIREELANHKSDKENVVFLLNFGNFLIDDLMPPPPLLPYLVSKLWIFGKILIKSGDPGEVPLRDPLQPFLGPLKVKV